MQLASDLILIVTRVADLGSVTNTEMVMRRRVDVLDGGVGAEGRVGRVEGAVESAKHSKNVDGRAIGTVGTGRSVGTDLGDERVANLHALAIRLVHGTRDGVSGAIAEHGVQIELRSTHVGDGSDGDRGVQVEIHVDAGEAVEGDVVVDELAEVSIDSKNIGVLVGKEHATVAEEGGDDSRSSSHDGRVGHGIEEVVQVGRGPGAGREGSGSVGDGHAKREHAAKTVVKSASARGGSSTATATDAGSLGGRGGGTARKQTQRGRGGRGKVE